MQIRIVPLLLVMVVSVQISAQTDRDLSTGRQVLANSEWRLVSMGRVGAESNVVSGSTVTLKFSSEDRISGSGGCNSYGGRFLVAGDRLTLSQIFSTKRACLDSNGNRQESQYFLALESAYRFRINSNRLTIYYDGGRGVLNFVSDTSTPDGDEPTDSATDPVAALNTYYQLINSRQYNQAYRFWESPDQTRDQFTRGFSDTSAVKVLIDPSVQIEGAAGSSYAELRVIVVSQRRNGGDRAFGGCYVMRKSNLRNENRGSDDGWRIYRARLDPISPRGNLWNLLAQSCR